jgi:hypothetical protein
VPRNDASEVHRVVQALVEDGRLQEARREPDAEHLVCRELVEVLRQRVEEFLAIGRTRQQRELPLLLEGTSTPHVAEEVVGLHHHRVEVAQAVGSADNDEQVAELAERCPLRLAAEPRALLNLRAIRRQQSVDHPLHVGACL